MPGELVIDFSSSPLSETFVALRRAFVSGDPAVFQKPALARTSLVCLNHLNQTAQRPS